MENRALSCFQSRGPLFFFVATLFLSLSFFIYICLYIFFLPFLFKFVFYSPLFVPLVSFKSQESSWLIFWCTLCLMYGVKSYVYRRRLMCWASCRYDIFLRVYLIEIIQFCRMNCECICLSLVSFIQFFLGMRLSLKVCLFIIFMKNIVNRYYNNRSNYDNFFFIICFVLIFLSNNYMIW